MAGIYIHIPFCRQKCYYCDFYKTVNDSQKELFLASLKTEAKVRKNYLQNEIVETIYFGGGTPSVLSGNEVAEILRLLHAEYEISTDAEITFEANPDDLSESYLQALKAAGVNRLSMGIQAFQDAHLKRMNRRHDAKQATAAVNNAAKMGFDNISVDLIYGLPDLSEQEWIESLQQVFRLPVQHLSAYHLTYHEGTPFYTWLKKGTLKEINETDSVNQFNLLIDLAAENGFEQYEISNFAREELYSKHNSSYWFGKKYLGLGPSAHSFDGQSRCWNVSHVERYSNAIQNNQEYFEEEHLNETDRYNEYIITRLRTKWGLELDDIQQNFGEERKKYLLAQAAKYMENNTVLLNHNRLNLSREGLFISDEIMTSFMII